MQLGFPERRFVPNFLCGQSQPAWAQLLQYLSCPAFCGGVDERENRGSGQISEKEYVDPLVSIPRGFYGRSRSLNNLIKFVSCD